MVGQLRLLGPVELEVDGTPARVGGTHSRAMLAYLALHAATTVPTARLIDAVWSTPPPSVKKSLTTQLARLRKNVAGAGISIAHTGIGYRCEVLPGVLDVAEFARLCSIGSRETARGDLALAAEQYRAALELWRSEPLEDLVEHPFVAECAAELVVRRRTAERHLVDVLVRRGMLEEAIVRLQGEVARDPFDEARWALLVRILASASRQKEALQAFRTVREMLRDELGIEPSGELRLVEREVLDQEAQLPDAEAPPTTFVGRADSLARMRQRFEQSATGGAQFVVIHGEPGIGKSAMVREFGRRTTMSGARMVTMTCRDADPVPLMTVVRAFATLADDKAASEIAPHRATIYDFLDGLGSQVRDLDGSAARLEYSLHAVAVAAARSQRLVLTIENLHWADVATMNFVRGLLERTSGLLVVATVRGTDLGADAALALASELDPAQVESIGLGPLSNDEVRALVQGHVLDLAEDTLEEIVLASGGNPLYVTQLAHLSDSVDGRLPEHLPASIGGLLRDRLGPVSADARAVLAATAVLGDGSDAGTLAAMLNQDPIEAGRLLEECRRAGILCSEAGDRFRFVHGLLEQVIYEDLDTATRSRLHGAAARSVLESGDEAAVARAMHVQTAPRRFDAAEVVHVALAGAAAASRLAAFGTAASLYHTALHFGSVDPMWRDGIAVHLAEVLLAAGDDAQGRELLTEVMASAESHSRWDLVADALLVTGRLGLAASTNEALQQAAAADAALLHISPRDAYRRVSLLTRRSNLLMNVRPSDAVASLEEAERLADASGSTQQMLETEYLWLRHEESVGARLSDTIERARSLRERALAADARVVAANVAVLVPALCLRTTGSVSRADTDLAAEITAQSGHAEIEVLLDSVRAAQAMATEPIPRAEELSERAFLRGQRHGVITSMGIRALQAFTIRREQLRLGEVEALLAAGMGTGRRGLQGIVAACRLESSDRPGAAALVDDFLDRELPTLQQDWIHDAAIALVADVAFDLGITRCAEDLYQRLLPARGQIVVMATASMVLGRADRYLGRLAWLMDDRARAAAHFCDALAFDEATGCRLSAGWTAHDLARVVDEWGSAAPVHDGRRLMAIAGSAAEWAGSARLMAAVGASAAH